MSLAYPAQAPSLEAAASNSQLADVADRLEPWFGTPFCLWDGEQGEILLRPEGAPACDGLLLGELVKQVAARNSPELVAERSNVVVLALPVDYLEQRCVATAPFVVGPTAPSDAGDAAQLLALPTPQMEHWLAAQQLWTCDALLRISRLAIEQLASLQQTRRLEVEIDKVSDSLAATYEEISLLHGVTQNLRINSSEETLGQLALDWLLECVAARGVALQYLAVSEEGKSTYRARTETVLLSAGACPLGVERFSELIERLGLKAGCGPYLANTRVTADDAWEFPEIQNLIITPLAEGDNVLGWMAAFNHIDGGEFGTVEASLLSSVSAILGIHSGNHELYRQQAEFLASVVRALTSAIDAKDPYTCGHSDRVARISVRLAKEMRIDENTISTLYMAGLLHDIGKIGIDDSVLRKPGRLTEGEYEHIKLHPELGHRILADIRQLAHVLPVVLHHHEQWDGRGYPHGLEGDEIPLLARITAVADAYDAMSSDRPYRKGLPMEKVEQIFREGAGQQWDAQVVEAFFAALDDILDISRRERADLSLDVQQWV